MSKRHRHDTASPAPARNPAAGLSRSRRRVFRIMALLLPILLVVLVEVGLRVGGYGYPTGYFLRTRNEGGPVLVSNPDFTRRFFPAGLERTPLPMAVDPDKPAGVVRIVLFGESAAMGDPAPAFGFGRILRVMLEMRHPGRRFEIVNVATTAINSHVLREMARDCATLRADVWILYIGNNEVVGPYGAGTIFSGQAPSHGLVRASLALKSTRIGQWLDAARAWAAPAGAEPAQWEGMEMFLDRQVPAHHPAMERVYDNFRRNLESIIERGRESGAQVILSTVVANLKDCAPFASAPLDGAAAERLRQARQSLEEAAPHLALATLLESGEEASASAEHHFLMGRSELALENHEEARRRFIEARDLDTLRFRVDSRMNRIIAQTAVGREGEGLTLVDAVGVFERQYPHRIVGGEYLFEHVHFNFAGNHLLARALAEEVERRLPPGSPPGVPVPEWGSAEECARALGYTDWAEAQVLDEMIRRLEQPPFRGQHGNDRRLETMQGRRAELQAGLTREVMEGLRADYARALERAPGDWELREQYGLYLEEMGGLEEALAQWKEVLAVVPNHVQARYHLANALDGLGRGAEAIDQFRRLLRQCPASTEALNGLALALDNQGRSGEAMELLRRAVGERPGFVEARINLGQLLARQGRTQEAVVQYEEALRLRTNSVAAHVNLGKLLAAEGREEEAERHYRAAVSESPHNAVAHHNLGNLLAARQDPEAAGHFEAAVRADPGFAAARVNWGLALAAQERDTEAMEQFKEAIRLDPNLAMAHLNLGVALAREQRLAEAVPHFEAALRLEPGNEAAREFLARARAMLDR